MRLVRTLIVFALVGLGLAAGLLGTEAWLDRIAAKQTERGAQGGRQTPVTVATARIATFRETAEAVGSTLARQSIDIVALAAGRVERIAFAGGEWVEAGQVLVELDDRHERVAVQESEALLVEKRAAYERIKSLRQRSVSSEAALEMAHSEFLRARAAHERARHALADRTVTAPFSGLIGLRRIEPGARVDTSTVIATLDDLGAVEIEFSLPEVFMPRVAPGQRVAARSDTFPQRVFEGQVSAIDGRVSPTARAFKLRATFPNEDLALRPGMFMSLQIVLDERDSIAVPEDAIVSEADKSFVYVVADGRARRLEVALGLRQEGLVEIRKGLEKDAGIIVTGLHSLEPGMPVRTVAPDGIAAGQPGTS